MNAHIVKLCTIWCGHDPSFFKHYRRYKIPRGTPSPGALNTRGGKNLQYSTKIVVYLGNVKRQAHGYYGSLIGSSWSISVSSSDLERQDV